MTTVELHEAFLWTCEECGRDIFERAVAIPPQSAEGKQIAQFIEGATYEQSETLSSLGIRVDGEWLVAPTQVKCPHCSSEFETVMDYHD